MKAAMCLELDQPLVVEDVTPLDPGPRDVVVRITASGVCHSDLSVINGTLPMPPPVDPRPRGHRRRRRGRRRRQRAGGRRPRDRLVHPRVRPLLVLPPRPVEPVREHLHGDDRCHACAGPTATALQSMTGLGTFAEMMTVDEHVGGEGRDRPPRRAARADRLRRHHRCRRRAQHRPRRARLDRRGHRVRRRRPGRHPGRAHRRRGADHRHRPRRAEARQRR